MEKKIPLGLYLWTRLRQLGIRSIMGVPGDMNLELLDYIDEVDGLQWVGNANELNAAYAADGYSRVKGCPGVIATTMGVGELSALNGIGGAYTEQVKVIHIVGTTSTDVQAKRLMIHHCLGPNPDHRVFDKISSHVRCAHTWLEDASVAPAEIDKVIRECYVRSLPVYIYVPMDMVNVLVEASRLGSALVISPPVNQSHISRAVEILVKRLEMSKNPVLLVDCLAVRHGAKHETQRLVSALDIPVFVTSMGKSVVDEDHARFCGVYNGAVSYPGVQEAVESSDCIVNVGPLLADSNTGGHTRRIDSGQVALLESNSCTIFGEYFPDVYLAPFLQALLSALQTTTMTRVANPNLPRTPSIPQTSTEIEQSWIWSRIGAFTMPGDILIAESGTAQFGFPDARFPANVTYVTQVYYGSIGYSVGCCLGAALAQRELQQEQADQGGRVILVVGDGSLQLTVQEIGTMIKHGLKPLIIIINNNGYTIERAIHGPERTYNDISAWRHQALLDLFGARDPHQCTRQVHSKAEMEEILMSPEFVSPPDIQVLEVFMHKMDIPWRLREQINIVNKRIAAKKELAMAPPVENASTVVENVDGQKPAMLNGVNVGSAIHNGHVVSGTSRSGTGKTATSAASLAIIGATGYIGTQILASALLALDLGRFRSVRILSSRRTRPADLDDRVAFHTVDYSSQNSIQEALEDVDVLISAAGMTVAGGLSSPPTPPQSSEMVITAAAAAAVRVYLPSEFGTDYMRSRYKDNALFTKKASHAARARHLGLKTVSLFTGLTMERSLLRWIARDKATWRVVGDSESIVSVTAERDAGMFAIETALLAFDEPESVPDCVRVSSADLNINEFAQLYEKVRGTKVRLDVTPLEEARAIWEKRKHTIPSGMIGPLIGVLIADGTMNHARGSFNPVLASYCPGKLSLRSIEDWLQSEEKEPWKGRALELD